MESPVYSLVNEPTQEQVDAFHDAWEAERKKIGRGIAPKGSKTRAGLRAALALIPIATATYEDGSTSSGELRSE